MAKIEATLKPTAKAIYAQYEKDNDDWRRDHLGASLIGDSCSRSLWYGFRWAIDPKFDGRILRLFERGQREESWIIEDLRALGMEVWEADTTKTVENEDGTVEHPQYRFEAFGGHMGGGMDGVVRGVLEAPKTPHVLEVKTSNDKRFKVLQRDGVKIAQPKHYAQVQTYMKGFKLKRALYVCVNKNTDEIYTERVHYDAAFAKMIMSKAENVIGSPTPLEKLSDDPSFWECKFCDHRPVCHGMEFDQLERNCRTCVASTPQGDGTWTCDHHGLQLDSEAQRKGCADHLFIPQLLEPWAVAGYTEGTREVIYSDGSGRAIVDDGSTLSKGIA